VSYDIHAVAIDYDGTLTDGSRPSAALLAAVRDVRASGRKCILVTGRILAELRDVFPDVAEHFDAIVGENGAVAAGGRSGVDDRALAPPVALELEDALRVLGLPVRRGHVLLASEAVYDPIVNQEIGRLGLECQIVRNRGELMILPAGVSKGTGLIHALDALNLSQHSTVGIGDAENDHSLLDACEIGVAVANAIEPLRARADIALDEADGAGVAAFLAGPVLEDLPGIEPLRHQLLLGTWADGSSARLPASRISIAIRGTSGGGKSWFAGSLAEQLIAMHYTVCVLDLEGDHVALADLHGVVAVGGDHPLPPVNEVVELLSQGITSVVVDLSLHETQARGEYARQLLNAVRDARRESGIPQWTFIDEAHVPLAHGTAGWWCDEPWPGGMCVITYRPDELCRNVREGTDWIITLDSPDRAMIRRRGTDEARPFAPASRCISHVRHWHKYTQSRLPPGRRFHFRNGAGPTGQSAANVREFDDAIGAVSHDVLRHHAAHRDFSKWLDDLCRDRAFHSVVRGIEAAVAMAASPGDVDAMRARLRAVIAEQFAA